MSNYNEAITANNTDLQSILDAVNALPEAGSGGGVSIETCTVTVTTNAFNIKTILYSTLVDGKIISTETGEILSGSEPIQIVVVKNMYIYINSQAATIKYDGDISDTYAQSESPSLFLINGDGNFSISAPCFARNTPITLANGTVKFVQDITYDDILLVWDFDNACYSTAKPLWIKKAETSLYYYHCIFENGIELKLIGSNGKCHRIFSLDDNRFESATDCVGKHIMTEKGMTKLLSCKRIDEKVEYYNIITERHINLYANSVLTSCRLNNLYPIKDMKFIKEERPIVPYETYTGIGIDYYNGLRLGEHKFEETKDIIPYVLNLYARMKEGKNT